MLSIFKSIHIKGFWFGLGAALAVSALSPAVGKAAKPAAIRGFKKVASISNKTIKLFDNRMEHMQDIFKNQQTPPTSIEEGLVFTDNHHDENTVNTVMDIYENPQYVEEDYESIIETLRDENSKISQEVMILQKQLDNLRLKLERANTQI